ncbi:hypothetical protein [Streptomyces lateritius]|uniref:hypothetical protein n=1 Tax=Streptomyces lateritius TaxID=67313 RepID=UPI001675A725|nr:hypothetical protein [Streptomyces lateritius]GGT89538.1 hypothetical protein GCM10010272_38000 [Streptomyces lateritius]
MFPRHRIGATLAAAALTVLVGCGSGSDAGRDGAGDPSGGPDAAPGAAPGAASAAKATSAFNSAKELARQVGSLELRITTKCMVAQGFTVHPPDPVAMPDADGADGPEGRVSPTSEQAAQRGYGAAPDTGSGQPENSLQEPPGPWRDLPEGEKQRYSLAKNGDPDQLVSYETGEGKFSSPSGGCIGETRKKLYGDMPKYLRLMWLTDNGMRHEAGRQAEQSDAFLKAVGSWSSCMEKAGYPGLKSPTDAVKKVKDYYGGKDAGKNLDAAAVETGRKKEIAQAKADAKCADTSKYDVFWRTANQRALSALYVKNEADLVAYQEILTEAQKKAQKMLES